MSLLCFIWSADGKVALRREAPQFLREFPSGFERDLHLRSPRATGIETQQPVPFFVCRHVAQTSQVKTVLPAVAQNPKPHPIPLVKSCLQKAIRRGNSEAAASAAAYLMAHDPKEFLRRLPVVLVEEIGILSDLPKVMWLAVAVQSGYEMQLDDIEFLLMLVTFAAAYPRRVRAVNFSSLGKRLEQSVSSFLSSGICDDAANSPSDNSEKTRLLSSCLVLRACYGGMAGDIEMLLAFAAAPEAWNSSIVPSVEELSGENLASANSISGRWVADLRKGEQCWGTALAPNDRLEAAVDMHCSDIIPQLLRYLRTRPPSSPPPTTDDLEETIWTHRSSINFRDSILMDTSGMPAPWWDHAVDVELSRLSQECWLPQSCPPPSAQSAANENAKRRKTSNGTGRQLSLFRFAATPPKSGGA